MSTQMLQVRSPILHIRTYNEPTQWLLMLTHGLQSTSAVGCNQWAFARAVVDDFGDLVIVRGWM